MANQHLTRPPTEVLRARLKVLLEETNTLYDSGDQVLEGDLVDSYNEALFLFMKSLDESIVGASADIISGMPADPQKWNVFTNSVNRDMEALFAETGALDRMIVSSFNSINSERDEVLQASKRISNKIGDYLLYSDPNLGAGFFFGDSFNSAERIEVSSSLLEGDECYLGQEEGVVLLPLEGEPDKPRINTIIINKPSNGNSGNNYEVGVVGKTEIEAISDGEPNTWYEYEKVSAYESDIPLVLDITLTLDEISIINHININPINFGTPTPVQIVTLETSQDGKEYRSIKDEVPLKDFIAEDEDETFSLSSATSKFAGQGFYSFLPRRVQFVHIVLRQDTPYTIQTNNGERLRYGIGLRDINILGRKFKAEGSIISKPFDTGGDVRKVSLWAAENPTDESALADVTHEVSEDDGAIWRQIQPLERDAQNIPEVINYNNIAEGSITTDEPVSTLRHKVSMKREVEAFQGDVVTKRERVSYSELVNVPAGNPDIILTNKPIEDSVKMIIPFFGSYSLPNARNGISVVGKSAPMEKDFLEFNIDIAPVDNLRFELPYIDVPNIQEHIRILINGEQIEFCEKEDTDFGTNTSYEDDWSSMTDEEKAATKIYFLNRGGREIQFRYQGIGFLPPGGAKIQICLDGDNPRLELTDKGYVINLTSPSDGFKENVDVLSIDALAEEEVADKVFRCVPGLDRMQIPLDVIGTKSASEPDDLEKVLDHGIDKQVNEASTGLPVPVINIDIDSWTIEEWHHGEKLTSTTSLPAYFQYKVPYINGRTELFKSSGIVDGFDFSSIPSDEDSNKKRYSFNPSDGVLYLGGKCPYVIYVAFKYQQRSYTGLPKESFEFYKSEIGEKINTSKLILDPKYVRTIKRIYEKNGDAVTSINLIGESLYQTKDHNWYKQRLVKGTIALDKTLFNADTKATEVPFINGYTELKSIVNVSDEEIIAVASSGIYSFNLGEINNTNVLNGSPGFAAVRSETDVNAPVNQFPADKMIVTTNPSVDLSDNDWCFIINTDNSCTIYIKTDDFGTHTAHYSYTVNDPGVDKNGLYSVDYENGIIHFADEVINTGNIQFETSTYSAFYNIADTIKDSDIKEIDPDNKKITVSDSLAIKLLKQSSAMKARPGYIRAVYDYYEESTENLTDLEPYFSPICKDIAFRAVTADVLEEL